MSVLNAKNLTKTFHEGAANPVINDVNLTIEAEEFVTITGKSGSGKSTLLCLLSGLEAPTSGTVTFRDQILHELSDKEMSKMRRRSFGFVFQFFNLVSSLNVWDNICLPVTMERALSQEKRKKIGEFVDILGIEDKLRAFPRQLSGGQKQRVAIARALAIDPDVIFADEPTGNLDAQNSDEVLQIFANLNKWLGKTIVMVTHDESISQMFPVRKLNLVNGCVEES